MPTTPREPAIGPLWDKDTVIYELYVKTFHDSNGDGIGDFRGLIEKFDYTQELGAITALWLLMDGAGASKFPYTGKSANIASDNVFLQDDSVACVG